MQIAGLKCGICEKAVLLAAEGTWCARCKTAVHKECLGTRNGMCPECRVKLDDPEKYFYYSKVCSMCGTSNVPPTKNCDYCLNQTVWDTEEEYAFFRTNVLAAGSKKILVGSIQILFGALIILVYALSIAALARSRAFLVSGSMFVGALWLMTRGGTQFVAGRRLRRFK
jgi:hypothetical protein